MKPAAFEHAAPADTRGALTLLAQPGAKPLSGGQSLSPMMNLRLVRPALLVDVKRLPDLRGALEAADHIRFGAAITHAEIEDGAVPDPSNGLMPHVAHGIAYRAVRNRGTLGGSLAHADPAADWPGVMAALGANIIALGSQGERRIPAEAFILAPFTTALKPGEIILAVEVPRLPAGARWGYCKINRKIGEFAKAIGIAIERPRRLLAGAVEGPPTLLESVDDIPTRLPWLDAAAQRLSGIALQRAIAMMEAA
ncbi:FAD binding domain-containing protein [Sediminicoccus sp. KRV36]|uniref:FAD binding domain-containing protein n=1 Tax=Sediminicoccus sp. KRV36 TaxID=3133721 RepID=UPI002010A1F4|nr:FAD binding domain-containing protein [Sediminicoccus rosea]UPY35707.1 FAD binding domain-containing protein [Sediminicoccus rosea]